MADPLLVRFSDAPVQIIDGDRGSNYPKKSDFSKHGYCVFLNTRNVTENGFDFGEVDFISEVKDRALRKGKASRRDIVLTTRGTIGNVGFYGTVVPHPNVRINSGMVLLRAEESELNSYYLYSFLRSELFKRQISTNGSGSAQPQLPIMALKNIVIPIPEIGQQLKIATVLSALDAKIDLNNRINAELEALAKTIYDYWFVQFEFPDAHGRPYKSSGGAMVWNDVLKREIPAGWKARNLSDIANITMGQSPAGDSYNEDGHGTVFFQGSTDFGTRSPDVRMYTTSPARMAKKGDILVSVRAPVGTMNIAERDCCIGRGLAALNSKGGFDGYLHRVMADFKQVFDRRSSEGTTFGSINKDDLFGLNVLIPEEHVLQSHARMANDWIRLAALRDTEIRELTRLRDWLLPLLMNGQVRVD